MRLGIVASRFNEALVRRLLERAEKEAKKLGAQSSVVSVPGALEIPLTLQWMAQSGRFDALVAIGAVIRGETYHFEVVANESRSEEHTSELQSHSDLVCRLLLEKKNTQHRYSHLAGGLCQRKRSCMRIERPTSGHPDRPKQRIGAERSHPLPALLRLNELCA